MSLPQSKTRGEYMCARVCACVRMCSVCVCVCGSWFESYSALMFFLCFALPSLRFWRPTYHLVVNDARVQITILL